MMDCCCPQMGNVAVFLIFTLILFGLFGMAFFKGKLRHTCHTFAGIEDGVEIWESTETQCDAGCNWDEAWKTTSTINITLNDGTVAGPFTSPLIPTDLSTGKLCVSLGANTLTQESQAHSWRWSFTCRLGEQCRCAETSEALPWCSYLDNPNYGITSFDSLLWAMVSLFQAISLEGWVDMMYQLMDGCSMFVTIYFILLVLFGAIIVMNLFLAVLCDNFEMADKDGPPAEKEEDPEKATSRAMAQLEHSNKFRQLCLDLVRRKGFDYFIQGCILFNTLLMCLKWAPQPQNPLELSVAGDPKWDYLTKGHWFFLTVFNILLTLIFTMETVVKVIGLGPKLYKKDSMNIFDAFVVAFSIIEICLELNKKSDPNATELPLPLSVLRAFRIFRLFKLVRSIETLRKILATLASSLRSVVYLALLLCLVILIFILLGMELFGGHYPHPDLNYTYDLFPEAFGYEGKMIGEGTWKGKEYTYGWGDDWSSRYNFDDFGSALLAIFVVLSGENWNEIMFDSHRATWDYDTNTGFRVPFAIIYFIVLFVVGNLLLFNLFIAILLSNFEDEEEEEEDEDDLADKPGLGTQGSLGTMSKAAQAAEVTMTWTFGQYRPNDGRQSRKAQESGGDEGDEEPEILPFPADNEAGNGDRSLFIFSWDSPVRRACANIIAHPKFEPIVLVLILLSTLSLVIDMPHLSTEHTLRKTISYFNYIFTVLFTIEMSLKIVAFSFVRSKTPKDKYDMAPAYLCSGWNVLDFLIVVISILSLVDTGVDGLQQLRAFRAIRPMRLVSRYESLKITFQTLLKSIPAMSSLISVAMLFFIIFAILGLELFGGKLGYCADPLFGEKMFNGRVMPGMNGEQNDYNECMSLPRYNLTRRTSDGILLTDMADLMAAGQLKDPLSNQPAFLDFVEFPQWLFPQFGTFDNVGNALMLLFEISALEGWPDVMHVAMDADGKEQYIQPWRIDSNPIDWSKSSDWAASSQGRPQASELTGIPTDIHVTANNEAAIFFILWIIFGCFVIVNMTIGVVVDTFSQIKCLNDGLLLMSDEAAEWVKAQKQVLAQRPLKAADKPAAEWRQNFYYLVTSTKFEVTIMVIIMLNMVQMGSDWFEPNPEWAGFMPGYKDGMQIINYIFFGLYVVEMFLKWVGLGVNQYFKNYWNMFDFCLVIISLIDVILSQQEGDFFFPAPVLRVLRLFRVARILRIVKTAKQLRTIMMTVYISVPQLKNILVLISLIIVIVDMLLVGFFSHVNYTVGNYDTTSHWTDVEANIWRGPNNETWRIDTLSFSRGERYYETDYYFSGSTNWGEQINRHANFAYFWTGLLTLVRSSTGESFNGIMHDLYSWRWGHNRLTCCWECGPILAGSTRRADFETITIPSTGVTMIDRNIPTDSCGDSIIAGIVYFTFQMVMAYIVLSIMIGIILENFANVGSETKKITMEDIEDFREVWLKYDPKGSFIVPSHNLLAILQQLKAPLGIQGVNPPMTRADMLKHLGNLDIPDHGGYIHFVETLTAVSNHHAGVPVPVCDASNKMAKATLQAPALKKLDKPAHNALTNYLVSLLQSRWRGYAMRKMYTDGEGPGDGTLGKVKASQVAPGPMASSMISS